MQWSQIRSELMHTSHYSLIICAYPHAQVNHQPISCLLPIEIYEMKFMLESDGGPPPLQCVNITCRCPTWVHVFLPVCSFSTLLARVTSCFLLWSAVKWLGNTWRAGKIADLTAEDVPQSFIFSGLDNYKTGCKGA